MTYCIWEPDAAVYLMPKSLSGWEHVWVGEELKLDVNSFYLVAPVDRTYYKVVGFTVNGEVDVRDTDTNMDDQVPGPAPSMAPSCCLRRTDLL